MTPVRSLFITLKRSFAGTREHHVKILQSLGLSYRQQTVEKLNAAHIRGAIDKVGRGADVRHMVSNRAGGGGAVSVVSSLLRPGLFVYNNVWLVVAAPFLYFEQSNPEEWLETILAFIH
jgi:ribosomal protein L30